MRFVKAHGAGNDFILLPDLDDRIALDAAATRVLCDRHLGVGADGVIRLGRPREGVDADVFMDYRNADGGAAEMCGNGVRCVAKWAADRGVVTGDLVRVDTRGGVKVVEVVARDAEGRVTAVRVDMGAPQPLGERVVGVDGHGEVPLMTLSMGNPHAVLLVDDVGGAPVTSLGPLVERHAAFPDGTNVEFIAVPSRDHVVGRIWERGVGETLASGTGGSAMAAAAHLLGLADRRVSVTLPGGALDVEWTQTTLFVTGPAVEVAEGELGAALLTEAGLREEVRA